MYDPKQRRKVTRYLVPLSLSSTDSMHLLSYVDHAPMDRRYVPTKARPPICASKTFTIRQCERTDGLDFAYL